MNKILLILLFTYSLTVGAQVKRSELPKLLNDTVYFGFDVYAQTVDQEAQQQAREFGLKRKVKKLQDIIHEKKKIEPIIDSLLYEIEGLEGKVDSLDYALNFGSREIVVDCVYEKHKYIAQKKTLQSKVIYYTDKLKKQKRRFRYSILIIAIETGVIILI